MDNFTNPNTQDTVNTYSQPGALTGESANWQSSSQTEQGPVYTETYANDFIDPSVGYTAAPEKKKVGFAITSLVLGILSILCCCFGLGWITAIPGIIFGIIAIAKKFDGKGCAVAGVVCSAIALVVALVGLILSLLGLSLPMMASLESITSDYEDYYDDYDYYDYDYDYDDYY